MDAFAGADERDPSATFLSEDLSAPAYLEILSIMMSDTVIAEREAAGVGGDVDAGGIDATVSERFFSGIVDGLEGLSGVIGSQTGITCRRALFGATDTAIDLYPDVLDLHLARYMQSRGLLHAVGRTPAVLPVGVQFLVAVRRNETGFIAARREDFPFSQMSGLALASESRHHVSVQYCNSSIAGACARNLSVPSRSLAGEALEVDRPVHHQIVSIRRDPPLTQASLNSAMRFSGVGSYVTMPLFRMMSSFSLDMWLMMKSTDGNTHTFVSKQGFSGHVDFAMRVT